VGARGGTNPHARVGKVGTLGLSSRHAASRQARKHDRRTRWVSPERPASNGESRFEAQPVIPEETAGLMSMTLGEPREGPRRFSDHVTR
jgi:hypothetical protein